MRRPQPYQKPRPAGDFELAVRMRVGGNTFQHIGNHFGVTKERARQMVNQALAAAGDKKAQDCDRRRRASLARYLRKTYPQRALAERERLRRYRATRV